MTAPLIDRLMASSYGHEIKRDKAGNSHVTMLHPTDRTKSFTIVAPTFDEAVARALSLTEEES